MLRRARAGKVIAVKIVIWLDAVEPLAGSVRLLAGPDLSDRGAEAAGVEFVGWLGLLRALYEVIGSRGERPPGEE
jgi:hypothetical protein